MTYPTPFHAIPQWLEEVTRHVIALLLACRCGGRTAEHICYGIAVTIAPADDSPGPQATLTINVAGGPSVCGPGIGFHWEEKIKSTGQRSGGTQDKYV